MNCANVVNAFNFAFASAFLSLSVAIAFTNVVISSTESIFADVTNSSKFFGRFASAPRSFSSNAV